MRHHCGELREYLVDTALGVDDFHDYWKSHRESVDHVRVDLAIVTEPGDAFYSRHSGQAFLAENLNQPHKYRLVVDAGGFAHNQPEQYLFAFDATHDHALRVTFQQFKLRRAGCPAVRRRGIPASFITALITRTIVKIRRWRCSMGRTAQQLTMREV
jgi:hypothetical protein